MDSFQRIYDKFKKTVSARDLISEGDVIIAALSGGSDSGALLMLLKEYSRETAFTLEAFHFNHMIRGGEALSDLEFSRELAEDAGVPFRSASGNVPEYARENKLSTETAARELRYRALYARAEELENETGRPVKIAVAHNMSDRAETVFLNIIRGTGIEGLAGIRYKNRRVIRPLLDVSKEETYEVLKHFGKGCRTDSTNFETEYKRNRLRLEVIPYIDEKMDCDLVKRLSLLADVAEEENGFLADEAARIYGGISSADSLGRIRIDADGFAGIHPGIRKRVLKLAVAAAAVDGRRPYDGGVSITGTMLERLQAFIENDAASGVLELGKGLLCAKKDGFCVMGGAGEGFLTGGESRGITYGAAGASGGFVIDAALTEAVSFVTDDGFAFAVRPYSRPYSPAPGEGGLLESLRKDGGFDFKWSAALDREALIKSGRTLVIRHPERGDSIRPLGAPGKKPLRRFLSDEGTAAAERPGLYVLACGSEICHVFGVRRGDIFAIQNDTKSCIIIDCSKPFK